MPGYAKVSVTITVTVDTAAWEMTYGVAPGPAQRADVKSYVLGQVQQSAAADEAAITAVEVK